MNSSTEHTVRLKWTPGSIAIWDNRCTAYKHISRPKGFETTAIGDKRTYTCSCIHINPSSKVAAYVDTQSESRAEREGRLDKEKEDERIRLEEIKKRFNETPLRRILRRQAAGGSLPFEMKSRDGLETKPKLLKTTDQPLWRPRSNSEIREQERKVWTQPSSTTMKEAIEEQPMWRPRSNSEVRNIEEGIWAKSADSFRVDENAENVSSRQSHQRHQRPTASRANSSGSPLRRIIQRQTSGSPGTRRKNWK